MKNLMSNFSGLALSRNEMKSVTGGCGVHLYKNGSLVGTWLGYSKAEAVKLGRSKDGLAGGSIIAKWCCASC